MHTNLKQRKAFNFAFKLESFGKYKQVHIQIHCTAPIIMLSNPKKSEIRIIISSQRNLTTQISRQINIYECM